MDVLAANGYYSDHPGNITRTLSHALEPFHEAVDNAVRSHSGGAETINREQDPAAFDACAREITELRQIGMDVPVHTIRISQIENVELPVSALFALDFMLEKE